MSKKSLGIIKEASENGTNLIATNKAFFDTPETLQDLFGAKIVTMDNDGAGNYLNPENKTIFKHFTKQKMLFWKFNLGLYDFKNADQTLLPVLAKGRPGPPEIIGGHDPIGYFALGIKNHPKSKSVLMPVNIGRLYYMHGYEEHKNIMLDVINYIYPEATQTIQTNAPARVETILQKYSKNIPRVIAASKENGMILHLVNLTGFSGNTYFAPLPLYQIKFKVKSDFKPAKVFSMTSGKPVIYTWKDGFLEFKVDKLEAFDGIVIDK